MTEGVEAIAIGFGCFALLSLLDNGGIWIVLQLGVQPRDVDLPAISLDDVHSPIIESLIAVLVCAAVAGACAAMRRRARNPLRAVAEAQPPA